MARPIVTPIVTPTPERRFRSAIFSRNPLPYGGVVLSMARSVGWIWLYAAAAVACQRPDAASDPPVPSASARALASSAPLASAAPAAPAPAARAKPAALDRAEFARLFREASEPDRYFFSDNYVSNETSYLQIISELRARVHKGGAYIGVGPEQNFSYMVESQPALAFVVDIRRGNALEHLLYKAIFEQADSRAQFLALLIGRAGADRGAPAIDANLDEVIAFVDHLNKDPATYESIHEQLLRRIAGFALGLSKEDEKTLADTHRAFFDKGLDLSFELHEKNGRKYPRFRQLIAMSDANGSLGGFLGSDQRFRRVRTLERENRVVPVVGDFAGDHALRTIAKELRRRDLPVSVFYVSNVEQYLLGEKWPAWVENIQALPSDEASLFIRCYLDQGRKHPAEMPGQRTATVLQLFDHFKWRQKKKTYRTFFELSTDGMLGVDGG
jgi:hypothetical protein